MGEPEPVGDIMRRLAVDSRWTIGGMESTPDVGRRTWVTWTIGVGVTMMLLAGWLWLVNRPPAHLADATEACRKAVLARIDTPSTARFRTGEPSGDDQVVYVAGGVDHQNAFGATVTSTFTCDAERGDSGRWHVTDLQFYPAG